MSLTHSPVICTDTFDFEAPECESCDGLGWEVYLHGPHEQTRECAECHGIGRRIDCKDCEDGVSPATDDTCETCDGFGALY
ncbi:hypothetical protein OTB20_25195 [Streptomyces sp. H27-H1]|uniref:hypothetical protein n=1 Tax=unclassified Streptomyces TaxID=2593676 RepID=UPI0022717733|nr:MULTISPECIES: hypothetical protein [unclassified Streptomyces]MCY0929435.1 hypothetical protein [Streptomyces sp. H27-H1]MCY0938349.1 hypothetical protein [Streptomyces sp. H34-S4]